MAIAVGNLARARENAGLTLADTAAFRALVGATSQGQALKRIHHCGLPRPADRQSYTVEELEALRPFAILFTNPEAGYTKSADAITESFDYADSGRILIDLEVDVPAEIAPDDGEVMSRAENVIGQILDDLAGLCGKDGYLAAVTLALVEGPYRSPLEEGEAQGDYWSALLSLDWGQGVT